MEGRYQFSCILEPWEGADDICERCIFMCPAVVEAVISLSSKVSKEIVGGDIHAHKAQ